MPFFFDHYPYTNFHNINLDWVLEAVKAWGALVEENNIKFHNLEEAMTSFRATLLGEWNTFHDETQNEINQFEIWTQNYLQNLDVQEEINTKLDEMLSSGVLSPYFAPYIQTDVAEWLEDNITPTSPAIDASLTISGAGADAAVTGRQIGEVKAELSAIDNQSLEEVVSMSGYKSTVSFVDGAYIDNSVDNVADTINSPIQSETWRYAVVSCSQGESYIINGNSGTRPKAVAVVDANYNVLLRKMHSDYSGTIDIPENGAYLIINRGKNNSRKSYKWTNNIAQNRADIEVIYGRTSTLEEAVTRHSEVIEQNSADVNSIYNLTGITEFIEFTSGAYINNSVDNMESTINNPISSSSWTYAIVDCTEGDTFYIDADSGATPKCYAFVDAEYNVLQRNTKTRFIGSVTAPSNAVKLIINKGAYNKGKSYIGVNKIDKNEADIRSIKTYYNQNIVLTGKENMAWSWWVYPQVVSFKRVRDKVYWGFTTSDGFIGVASYDVETKAVTKNLLRKSSQIDDHNGSAVYVYDDGTILVAYSSGHGEDKYMRVRVSEVPECIERFGEEILLESSGTTTYSQLIYYDSKLYLFYRSPSTNWCYRYTADKGVTWSDEVTLITSDIQYYCKFSETTTQGVIRVCMYSNPSLSDANIRQAFLHLDNGKLYNSDNVTELGTSNVSKNNVSILIPIDSSYNSQRLLDVAVTDIDKPLIIHAPYTGNESMYRIYDSGVETDIVIGGTPLITSYMLGASWIGTSKIVACRGSAGNDVVTLYNYSNNTVTIDREIYREQRGAIPIRNARPIVDVNSKYLLWQRGYYGNSFNQFNMDAMIYDVINNQ